MTDQARVAIVTGAGRPDGIGRRCAEVLRQAGMAVVATDVELKQAGGAMPRGDGIDFRPCDVSDSASVSDLVEKVVSAYGRVDIVINNAAAAQGADRLPFADIPLNEWDRVMNVNAKGVFLLCRLTLPIMQQQGWGRIVNISSAVHGYGAARRAIYAASKASIAGLSRSLAIEFAPAGITVNCVAPGSVLTARAIGTTMSTRGDVGLEEALAMRAQSIPARRHGTTSDIATAIRFLCSEDASYLTGQEIVIDGGGLPVLSRLADNGNAPGS